MAPGTPIRAIAGRFASEFSRKALEKAMKEHHFEYCASISLKAVFRPFPNLRPDQQEWFDSGEIRNALYSGVDWNALAPLDEKLVTSMTECESIFLSIVSRLEWKRPIPYLTRKLWYLRHLQFWNDYLMRHRINLYLSTWMPHEIPDLLIYCLCKARGIPVLYFTMEFRDVSFTEREIGKSDPNIGRRYEELLTEYAGRDPGEIPISEPFASYERGLLPEKAKPMDVESFAIPDYWDRLRDLVTRNPVKFLARASSFLTPAGWSRAWWSLQRWRTHRSNACFYDAHATTPDLTRPYVYLPLHYQPEATTVPMGGIYADQILIARMLNALLPEGVLIYVKEHPNRSSWLVRSVDSYRDFVELKKVRLVPKTCGTFALREHCTAVATVSGSAGFEGLFRGKPCLLFGSRYYMYARGVFPIRSTEDCRKAIAAVFERGEGPTLLTTHLYLKAMEDVAARGVLDSWALQISEKTPDEHAEIMGAAISKELTAMEPEIARIS